MEEIICENPKCLSNLGKEPRKVVKFGTVPTVHSGKKQRYRCQVCAETFYGEEVINKKEVL